MAQRICDVRVRWPNGAMTWVGPFLCQPGDTAEDVKKDLESRNGFMVLEVVFSEGWDKA